MVWIFWVAHATLFLLLPGYLWLGRHLRGVDWMVRGGMSVAGGLALVALYALGAAYAGPWLRPWHYLVVVVVWSIPVGLSRRYCEAIAALVPAGWRLHGTLRWLVLLACLLLFLPVVLAQVLCSVPAAQVAGHTLLVTRVSGAQTIDISVALADMAEIPGLAHGLGWHAAASLIAQVGRMDAFLTTWMLPLGLVLGLPVMFWLAWRALGFGARGAAWATVLLPAMAWVPEEVLTWGGMGYLVGWYVMPVGLLALRAARLRGGPASAVLAAVFGVVLLMVNALEVFPMVIMALLAGALSRRHEPGPRRWMNIAVGGAVFLFCALLAVHRCGVSPRVVFAAGTGSAAGGGWLFYGNLVRPYHLILFACIPLVGWTVARAWRRVLASRVLAAVFMLACALWLVVMDAAVLNRLAEHSDDAIFVRENRRFARDIGSAIANHAVIANLPGDGSEWAMVLSGRRFLIPGIWPGQAERGAELRHAVLGLQETKWSAATLALQRLGVRYLFVSDRSEVVPGDGGRDDAGRDDLPPFSRRSFDSDPRFWPVIEGESATVYEILWSGSGYMLANLI